MLSFCKENDFLLQKLPNFLMSVTFQNHSANALENLVCYPPLRDSSAKFVPRSGKKGTPHPEDSATTMDETGNMLEAHLDVVASTRNKTYIHQYRFPSTDYNQLL
jgi:hypothetical protein